MQPARAGRETHRLKEKRFFYPRKPSASDPCRRSCRRRCRRSCRVRRRCRCRCRHFRCRFRCQSRFRIFNVEIRCLCWLRLSTREGAAAPAWELPKVHLARVRRNTDMFSKSVFVFRTNHLRVGGAEAEFCKREASRCGGETCAIRQYVHSPIQRQPSFFQIFTPNEPPRFAQSRQLHQKPTKTTDVT